jgi:hypothetical protein
MVEQPDRVRQRLGQEVGVPATNGDRFDFHE